LFITDKQKEMSTYYDLFMNQFYTTLGQVTAVTISASFLVPMYQFYSMKLTRFLREFDNQKYNEDFQGGVYEPADVSGYSDTDVEDDDEVNEDTSSEPVLLNNTDKTESAVSDPQTADRICNL
jgi:hypothetical protein